MKSRYGRYALKTLGRYEKQIWQIWLKTLGRYEKQIWQIWLKTLGRYEKTTWQIWLKTLGRKSRYGRYGKTFGGQIWQI